MINSLKFKLKKLWYRRVKYQRKRNPPTNTDNYVYGICVGLMMIKDTDLFVAPASGDRYIQNKDKGIDISIKDNTIHICNHSYNYTLSIGRYTLSDIIKYHNRVLESRKRVVETTMGNNINISLAKILEGLK